MIELGELVVDLEKHTVTMAGEPVHLTPHQFELLRVLAANEGKLLTHRTLLQEVWGPGYGNESNLLHVNISQLRRKIEPDRARPRYLLTEPGAGYRLVNPLAEPSGFLQVARRDPQTAFSVPLLPWPHASFVRAGARLRDRFLMYDLAAIGIGAACFAFVYLFLVLLDRV